MVDPLGDDFPRSSDSARASRDQQPDHFLGSLESGKAIGCGRHG